LLKSVYVRESGVLVGFGVASLLTNVPVGEIVDIIRNKLLVDDIFAELSVLEVDVIMDLLEVCLKTTCF
jgi:hypothetical protein